jgi:3-hydroxyacyl-[acyl-carrier-protein] dehydratase
MTLNCSNLKSLKGTFVFDPADRIYADHFPGNPIVPGSMIVHAFTLAAEGLEFCAGPCSVRNFRFRRFIAPGEYSYHIEIAGDEMKCTLHDGHSVVATGVLTR